MDIPFAFSFSGIVSYFWIFCLCLIALLLYLFSKAVKAVKGISIVTIPNNSNIDTQLFLAVLRSETRRTCCACCGIAQDDKIKLKECDDCDLVRYCSDKCQTNDSSEHAEECKMRVAELLRDGSLFKQPESSHLGDCPICCLPMPLDLKKCNMMMCCSASICKGCDYTNQRRNVRASKEKSCPFCRAPMPLTDKEVDILLMKRIEANDPDAMNWKGNVDNGNGDYSSAFELFTKAAALGDVDSHYRLSNMYFKGTGVERDEGKEIHHMEEAAICGHPLARYSLGLKEWYGMCDAILRER